MSSLSFTGIQWSVGFLPQSGEEIGALQLWLKCTQILSGGTGFKGQSPFTKLFFSPSALHKVFKYLPSILLVRETVEQIDLKALHVKKQLGEIQGK